MAWKTWHEDARVRIVSDGELLIAVWTNAPLGEQMRALGAAQLGHHDQLGALKQIFVNLVIDGTPEFSDEVRKSAVELSRRGETWETITAHIIMIPGLRGIAVRSFVSTFVLLARAWERTSVFGDVQAAAKWIAKKHGSRWTEQRVEEALTDAGAAAKR